MMWSSYPSIALVATAMLFQTALSAPSMTAMTTTMTTSQIVFAATETLTTDADQSIVVVTTTENPVTATVSVYHPTITVVNPGIGGNYTGAAFTSAMINSTNWYRTHYDAAPLEWNSSLTSYAQTYAEKCLWKHSGGPYGENLAEGYGSTTDAVDAWGNEEALYDYSNPGFSEATGHFTQLVWESTVSMGCAAVNCTNHSPGGANGWYVVCEYWPPGNVGGEYSENVSKPGIGKGGKPGFGSGSGAVRVRGHGTAALAVMFILSIILVLR